MNGTCQTCGTVAPIEWFLADAEYRQLCALLTELPGEVQKVVFHYLGLFRPAIRSAIHAKKALRLIAEIKAMVASGYVQVDKKVSRPCPPRIWALAMEQMVERRERLNLPMPNHNYMKQVAYDLADQADSQAERQRHAAPISRSRQETRTPTAISSPLDQYIQGLRDTKPTDEEMNEWKAKRLQ